jgi:hypothetical protein
MEKDSVNQSNVASMPDLDVLEKLAKAATPGPWKSWFAHWGQADISAPRPHWSRKTAERTINGIPQESVTPYIKPEDANFIAAANPDVVLGLIALVRKLQAETDAVSQVTKE